VDRHIDAGDGLDHAIARFEHAPQPARLDCVAVHLDILAVNLFATYGRHVKNFGLQPWLGSSAARKHIVKVFADAEPLNEWLKRNA
jgi:hypothetical protein